MAIILASYHRLSGRVTNLSCCYVCAAIGKFLGDSNQKSEERSVMLTFIIVIVVYFVIGILTFCFLSFLEHMEIIEGEFYTDWPMCVFLWFMSIPFALIFPFLTYIGPVMDRKMSQLSNLMEILAKKFKG